MRLSLPFIAMYIPLNISSNTTTIPLFLDISATTIAIHRSSWHPRCSLKFTVLLRKYPTIKHLAQMDSLTAFIATSMILHEMFHLKSVTSLHDSSKISSLVLLSMSSGLFSVHHTAWLLISSWHEFCLFNIWVMMVVSSSCPQQRTTVLQNRQMFTLHSGHHSIQY